MGLPLQIAFRYLFAPKSHKIINVISAISSVGMAVGTAALILILSIYNGFNGIIESNMTDLDPDLVVQSRNGKYFNASEIDSLCQGPGVVGIYKVLKEDVFVKYEDRQTIAEVMGVDTDWEAASALGFHVGAGEFSLHRGDIRQCAVGSALAYRMGIHPRFLSPVTLYYPDRTAAVSPSNPAASLHSSKVFASSLFSISSETDSKLMVVPIETMQEILCLGNDWVSGVEIRMMDNSLGADGDVSERTVRRFKNALQERLGDDYVIKTRLEQNPSLYKMMKYEKLAIFAILVFVIIIIAFNIFGSLSMLIIEKEDDIRTLHALGATRAMTRRIFVLEGWMISLAGLSAGLLVGVILALIQMEYGIIKMPGGFMISSYPVVIKISDLILTAVAISAIGLLTALLSTRKEG